MTSRAEMTSRRRLEALEDWFSQKSKAIQPFDTTEIEADAKSWLCALFPETYSGPLADYHLDCWRWLFEVESGETPSPYVAVWPRGWAKSTNAEVAAVFLGATQRRKYGLYICETQPQADDHVQNIATRLESASIERYYPNMGERYIGKFGNPRGWRRNRLSTSAGFTIDAIGLDTASRGVKLDDERPDFMVIDDVDSETDSPETITKKINTLTKRLLPAGAPDLAVMVMQNLVHRNGIVSQIVDGRADFLAQAIVSGPHPAILDLETEGAGKDAVIVAGTPTWAVMGIEQCQVKIALFGLSAFLSECQHKVELAGQPRFNLEILELMRHETVDPLPGRMLPAHLQGLEGLRVYSLPKAGTAYVSYIDPAEGKGRDYTATGVMEVKSKRLVAVLEDNQREPQKHAEISADLWEWYNRGLIGYERAKGEAVAWTLGARGVTRIYEHEDNPLTPQQQAAGLKPKLRPGFPMTAHTKRSLIDRLADAIDRHDVGVPDKRTIEQCETYIVTEQMTTQATPGGHDDLVIMLAGLLLLTEQPGASSVREEYGQPIDNRLKWGYG